MVRPAAAPIAPKADVGTTRLTPASRAALSTLRLPLTAGSISPLARLVAGWRRRGAPCRIAQPAAASPQPVMSRDRRSRRTAGRRHRCRRPSDAPRTSSSARANGWLCAITLLQQRQRNVRDEPGAAGDENRRVFICQSSWFASCFMPPHLDRGELDNRKVSGPARTVNA